MKAWQNLFELDLPLKRKRTERLQFIKDALDNPTVSPAEKLRQVLEGFNVEAEYGRKIDTYKDTILIDGQDREVNILRVGRMVLAYQTTDLDETGIWNKETNSGKVYLEGTKDYRDGISMAKKLKTVDMLELPIPVLSDSMKSLLKILIIFSLIFSGSIFSQETQKNPKISLDLDQLPELVKQEDSLNRRSSGKRG